ncbi:MAG: alcohol dehydrogenase catalytic domain-containing protein, partial [Bacillota bacterium]|nr:alcohol dehydrogenase catalytic domain-containing protein [Bacillota bacterium]
MINYIYQLVSPQVFSIKYDDVKFGENLILRPCYMAICHADQRYYRGLRDRKVLARKLPMALIHECCGTVVYDPSGKFQAGQYVVPIPNVPPTESSEIYENYATGSAFLSSGLDGFLREYVDIDSDRVVAIGNVSPKIAAITEFISVAVHGVHRLKDIAHNKRDVVGIWGDGSLGFVVAAVLKKKMPESRIIVIGKDERKLS